MPLLNNRVGVGVGDIDHGVSFEEWAISQVLVVGAQITDLSLSLYGVWAHESKAIARDEFQVKVAEECSSFEALGDAGGMH